jgi:hypothetical protein
MESILLLNVDVEVSYSLICHAQSDECFSQRVSTYPKLRCSNTNLMLRNLASLMLSV